MFKALRHGLVVGGVIGAPYLWSQVPQLRTWGEQISSAIKSQAGGEERSSESLVDRWLGADASLPESNTATVDQASPNRSTTTGPSLVGGGGQDIRQVLRFDIDPRWVTEYWSHVETFSAERNLLGMRVPIVTGTQAHDVAGSLTYFFDTRHRLQRVVLHGRTGDERPLVQFAEQAFGLRAEPALAAGLYIARWNGEPHNILYARFAPLVRSDVPHSRFDVWMEINQLDIGVQLSAESQAILTHLHQATGLSPTP